APRRRIPAVSGSLRAPGPQAAPVQPGLAYPFGPPAGAGYADLVLDVADAGRVLERGECRDLVGLHRPLSSRRDAADAPEVRRSRALCHPLFSRLRAAAEEVPRAERGRACGASRPARGACATPFCFVRRANPAGGLRSRPARAVSR